jgi:hypothetical protein
METPMEKYNKEVKALWNQLEDSIFKGDIVESTNLASKLAKLYKDPPSFANVPRARAPTVENLQGKIIGMKKNMRMISRWFFYYEWEQYQYRSKR